MRRLCRNWRHRVPWSHHAHLDVIGTPAREPIESRDPMPMRIILANPRGFCAGVNMAIECVDRVLQVHGPPVYVYHEIVHNKHVVEDFKDHGVTFVDDFAEVPEGGLVVYSAHGISPAVRE